MFDIDDKKKIGLLIDEANEAAKFSYAPYSNFHVGAAVIGSDGRIFRGCNVENSSYPATNCAERTAIFTGIANGMNEFEAIAIVGGIKVPESLENGSYEEYCYPCGVCRQVMLEFCNPEKFFVILSKDKDDYKVHTLAELLPHGFKLNF